MSQITSTKHKVCCVIRISKILLYAIHNSVARCTYSTTVVLSGFQRYFCMQYTTMSTVVWPLSTLCYQDFKDTFVCNTQRAPRQTARSEVVLSGFQRYFCMQYTTTFDLYCTRDELCYQDFKDTFVCNTQPNARSCWTLPRCVIRISKILLYAIHNLITSHADKKPVRVHGVYNFVFHSY